MYYAHFFIHYLCLTSFQFALFKAVYDTALVFPQALQVINLYKYIA